MIAQPRCCLVQRSGWSAFAGRAVIGHQGDDGVVGKALFVEECQDAADLGISVRHESGEHFHVAREQASFIGRQG